MEGMDSICNTRSCIPLCNTLLCNNSMQEWIVQIRGGGSKNSLVGLNAKLLSNFNFNN